MWLLVLAIVLLGIPSRGAAVAPNPTQPIMAVLGDQAFIALTITGTDFGAPAASSKLIVTDPTASTLTIGSRDQCGTSETACVVSWSDTFIIAKIPNNLRRARVQVKKGTDLSLALHANYYRYTNFDTDSGDAQTPGANPHPLAVTVDTQGRIWINEELHLDLKMVDPALGRASRFPIPQPDIPPFATPICPSGDCPARYSGNGEDVLVDPKGRVWFSEGGAGYWTGQTPNHSRVVMYDPSIGEFRVYNVPGNKNGVVGLGYQANYLPGRDRVWFDQESMKYCTFCNPFQPAELVWFDPENAPFDNDYSFATTAVCQQESSGKYCRCPTSDPGCPDGTGRLCDRDEDCVLAGQACDGTLASPPSDCFFHQYPLPGNGTSEAGPTATPAEILVAADGAVWYTAYFFGNHIGRLDPATGAITYFPLPTPVNDFSSYSAPWEIQAAPNGDIVFTEYDDNTVNRLDITRMNDPACGTLSSGQNPCMHEWILPGLNTQVMHSVALDSVGNAWATQDGPDAPPAGEVSITSLAYVRRDWSAAVLLPPLSLFYPSTGVTGTGCVVGFQNFKGAGIVIDPPRESIWFADYCRQRVGRLQPLTTDVALAASATQSSTYFGRDAARAVDGNPDGYYPHNTMSVTGSDAQAWWQVDLGQLRSIEEIELWNRTDCCSTRLSNFYVFVSDAPFTSTNLNATLAQPGVSAYYTAGAAGQLVVKSINRTGRYVRVQLTGTDYLQLAEVAVLGRSIPECTTASQCDDGNPGTVDTCDEGRCAHH